MSESSQKAILFYDGDCPFCRACVRFIEKRDPKERIKNIPLQESEYARTDACYDSILFVRQQYQSQFSTAVIDVLKTIGGFWYVVGAVLWFIPRPIRDWVYRWVGSHRSWFAPLVS